LDEGEGEGEVTTRGRHNHSENDTAFWHRMYIGSDTAIDSIAN
jgi:hypothetical protein